MAQYYKVSADTSEKEKIFGGVLTLAQAAWLFLGLLIGFGLFMYLQKSLGYVTAAIVALPPGLAVGGAFAFYKKHGLSLLTYLRYKHKFDMNSKTMVNDLVYGKTFTAEDELFQ